MILQIDGYDQHEDYDERDYTGCTRVDSRLVVVDLVLIQRFFLRLLYR